MCYAIPGKVEEINQRRVTVSYFGERKRALNDFFSLSPGDYIYAQGGFVIEKIPPKEAEDILAAWEEVFFELKGRDLKLSRLDLNQTSSKDKKLMLILNKALANVSLTKEEGLYLLNLQEETQLDLLFKTANALRQKYHQNSCCVHGIIEISNYCLRNCYYCGISIHNRNLERYRMTREEILETTTEAVKKYGFKALVMQSGEDHGYSIEELASIINEIKTNLPVLIFISFGEIGIEGLKKLYAAGARGLLLRFETSNPQLYQELHPGYNLNTRLEHIKEAYKMGYLIATGSLIGLPGQSKEDIINDIFLAKELEAEMFSFGPVIPHPETPLANMKLSQEKEILKVLAIARLIEPVKSKILVTTGFETLSSKARVKGLLSGASSVMLNATPSKYRTLYSIYPNRAHSDEEIEKQISQTIAVLKSIGRAPTDLGIGQ